MEEIKQLTLELETEKKCNSQKINCLTKLFDTTKIDGTLIDWLKKESDTGNTWAHNNLGYMYYCGEGVEIDYKEAIKLYKLSADQGNAVAQNNLGHMYYYGEGTEKDHKEAIKFYKLSANQGCKIAKKNLRLLYKENDNMKIKELEKKCNDYEKEIEDLKEENKELKYMAPYKRRTIISEGKKEI
jgi:TPR repeat protein